MALLYRGSGRRLRAEAGSLHARRLDQPARGDRRGAGRLRVQVRDGTHARDRRQVLPVQVSRVKT